MLRSFARRGGIVLAALALPVLFIGTAATATTPSQAKLASATINGDGSTFQLGFNQVCIGEFKKQQKAVTINYQGNGSGAGRTDFVNGVVDFAGTDAAYKSTDPQPPKPFLYFPTVVAPITVSYNLSGVKLNLSPETTAKIFSGAITTWDDAAIKTDNPKAKLPSTAITVVHRSDSSGTTANFTSWLTKAAPTDWTLGSSSTVSWGSGHAGRHRQLRCGQAREGHRRRGRLRRLLRRQRQRPDLRVDQELGRQIHQAEPRVRGRRGGGCVGQRRPHLRPDQLRRCRPRTRSRRRRGSSCTRTRPMRPRATRSRAS